jgi:hypothetical protein
MASSIAFGRIFTDRGWWLGAARTVQRVWQVYWAHIGLFFAIAATQAAIDLSEIFVRYGAFEKNYIKALALNPFFDDPMHGVIGLMTLTYVPNYFDILPMYLVILAMIPLMMALAKVHPWLPLGTSAAIWAVTQTGALALPAEPWTDREWFFNPLGWQLLFFTGFGLIRGWLPKPPIKVWLVVVAMIFLAVSVPFGRWQIYSHVPWIEAWRQEHFGLFAKTNEGILRYLHFLALAYLAWIAVGPGGERLKSDGATWLGALWSRILTVILKVGQQSLAVFVFSMWLALMLGFLLDLTPERGIWPTIAVNILGLILLSCEAYVIGWFKAAPWRHPPKR